MLRASFTPTPPVYDPIPMSKPFFKRQKTFPDALRPQEFSSRPASPAGSFYGDGPRPYNLPPRGASPVASFYSQSSSSSPSFDSASSSGSRKAFPAPSSLTSSWLTRAPRIPLSIVTPPPSASEFASPPGTPVEVSEAELRRRQLEKATRILGESVPLELVFQPRHPLAKAFPPPPPRRSTDSPQPGQQPRETLTERRPKKLARRASLSLSTFAAKFRTGSHSTNHSRDSSQESHSPSSSDSQHSRPPSAFGRALPRRRSAVLSSPILFAFPRRSPTRAQMVPPPTPPPLDTGLVIDIRSPDPSVYGHDDDEATPVCEAPSRLARSHVYSSSEVLPRIVPMPTHAHTDSEPIYPRPETPFADYTRPATPFDRLEPEEDEPTITSTMYLSPGVSRKERGQGWSGEWNQRDMQDVIQKLRSLK
ncbi:hypothetical protein MVEN_00927000 [Mycena venus]|uniref:Uncharacterized protein n=1 Tax=Mycena venus TaxID=2733690 RepID=A0A8H7D1U1_9AGAR|nr:hypothetical protein MVEN_00927000 [Mycena venus]